MRRFTLAVLAGLVASIVTCTGPETSKDKSSPTPTAQDSKKEPGRPGWIHLNNGQKITGRILSVDRDGVDIETDEGTVRYVRPYLTGYCYDKTSSNLKIGAAREDASPPTPSAASWFPRRASRERMDEVLLHFFDKHDWKGKGSCVGDKLAGLFSETPEFYLLAPRGGRLVVKDSRKLGFHGHALGPDREDRHVRPTLQSPLTIEFPKDRLPDAVALVSAAHEIQAVDRPAAKAYAVPDVVYAKVRELASPDDADAFLSVQPFAGGRAQETKSGKFWSFALSRSSAQWWFYAAASDASHAEALESSYVTYGSALIVPDLILEILDAQSRMTARIFLLPMPPGLSPDGPAAEPAVLRTGKERTELARVEIPRRFALVAPPQPPALEADVHLHFYGAAKTLPERRLLAWGTGPAGDEITASARDLAPETRNEHLTIDLSKRDPAAFPAVAWLVARRTLLWKETGGYLTPLPQENHSESRITILPGKELPAITNEGSYAHAVPILFLGPPAAATGDAEDREIAALTSGASNALLADALRREAGAGFQALTTLGDIATTAAGGGRTGEGGRGGEKAGDSSMVSNTYVNIAIPPHTDLGGLGGARTGGGTGGQSFATYKWDPKNYGSGSSVSPFLGANQSWGQGMIGNYDVVDPSGKSYNRTGDMIYDPATGTVKSSPSSSGSDIYVDRFGTPSLRMKRQGGP